VAATFRDDRSADVLILGAARRGIEVFRFNTEDYPAQVRLSIDPVHPEAGVLHTLRGTVSMGQTRGIWIRRPQWPVVADIVTDRFDRALAQQEAVAAMGGAWRCLARRCVSPPDAIQASRWKLPQLKLAHELGIPVPHTLVTQDAGEIRRVLRQGRAVVKAVGEAWVVLEEGERSGETTELALNEDLRGVVHAPVLVQSLVPKVADWRITLVGRQLFPVRMRAPEGAPVDVRATVPEDIQYEVHNLPVSLADALVAFANQYGLRYAAFDMAEDVDGTLWFLECNPAGQWAWLEPPTGLKITDALIDLLLDPTA
jgi:glutathione synthase/RimK-type ligase-like ATP-grasp enzyme